MTLIARIAIELIRFLVGLMAAILVDRLLMKVLFRRARFAR